MNIKIQYYAQLREARGQSEEIYSTRAQTARDLYLELKQRYNFPLEVCELQIAIGDQLGDWNAPLIQDDVVTFLPPVGGG